MSSGWLKLHRKALKNPALREPDAFRFWCFLLSEATHQPTTVYRGKGGRPVRLEAGQLVISTTDGIDGLSRKRARTLLDRFTKLAMISVETRRDTGHTITVQKWREYQHPEGAYDSEGPSKGTYNGQATAKQGPTAQEGKEGKEESTNVDSVEQPQAAASTEPVSGKPLPRRERYPSQSKLPMNGRGKKYPDEFEAAWQEYPTVPNDTKQGCYAHWRSWVVERRVSPDEITAGARRYAAHHATDEYRFGFLRWCREGLWTMQETKRPEMERPRMPGEWA